MYPPWQLQTDVQIIPDHRRLCADIGLLCQLVDLLFQMLAGLLIQLQCVQLLAVLVNLVVLVLAQFVLKHPDLGTQDLLPLLLGQFIPNLTLHLALIAQHIPLTGQKAVELPQPHHGGQLLQNRLLIVIPQGDVLRDEIRQIPRLLAVQRRGDHFLSHIACQLGVILKQTPCLPQERFGFRAMVHRLRLLRRLHLPLQIRFQLPQPLQSRTAAAFHHDPQGILPQTQDLRHAGDGADGVEILLRGLFHVDLALGHQKDLLTCLHGHFQRFHGDVTLHVKGQVGMGKNRQAPEGQNGKIQSFRFHNLLLSGELKGGRGTYSPLPLFL